MVLVPGSIFGPYRIIEPLGRGGMASVYRAYEAALDRYVALKILPAEFLHEPTFAERFRREAKVIARLEHPNIIPIYAFDIEGGVPWMAMRLIARGSLAALLKGGRLLLDRSLAILRGAASALDYAHAKGVLHRDVKPQNILLDEAERVYLADFGIARMVEGSPTLTASGMISGTPQYMAPEQATAQTLDHRVDIYALGIVAYEMLTGRVPFAADTPVAVLMKHVSEPMPIPSETEVPEPLVRALLKCMAKKPEDRWASTTAFVEALEQGLAQTRAPAAGVTAPTLLVPMGRPPTIPVPDVPPSQPTQAPRLSGTEATSRVPIHRAPSAPAGEVAPQPSRPPEPTAALTGRPEASRRREITTAPARPGWLVPAAIAGVVLVLVVSGAAVLVLKSRGESETEPTALVASATLPATTTLTPSTTTASAPAPVPLELRQPAPSPPPTRPAPTTLAEAAVQRGKQIEGRLREMEAKKPVAPPPPSPTLAAVQEPAPTPPPTPVPTTSIRLDVDAAQDPRGPSAVDTLYIQVRVDGRALGELTLSFSGKDMLSRSRKRQVFEIAGVPVGRRTLTVLVADSPAMSGNAAQGSAEVTVAETGTRLFVQVRERVTGEREVRFR